MKCPICGEGECKEFIVDLLICNTCSHVFKKEPKEQETILSEYSISPMMTMHKSPISQTCCRILRKR